MELADGCAGDPAVDAEDYEPMTLKTKIQARGSVGAGECVRLGQALTEALAFLHEQGLLHRDIKPSNIIFVQGQPKLADIGLVTGADETRSFVGTEGYIPPEGPGTPAADVFSLGKVLNELIAGTECDHVSEETMRQLRRVIEKSCARNLVERYPSGKEMLLDLRSVPGG